MSNGGVIMKIICSDQHLSTLKSLLRDYLYLDIVLVEKGYDYEDLLLFFNGSSR